MWTILSETRRKCWRSWAYGAAIFFVLALAQTVFGKFEGILLLAWSLVLLCGFSGFAVLTFSIVINRSPDKIIPDNVHRTLLFITRAYLVMVALTIMAEPFATRGRLSTGDYLLRSAYWLLPALIIILAVYWLFFFKKEPVFLPNPQIILETADRARKRAMHKGKPLQQQFFGMVAEGKIVEAMEHLSKYFDDSGSADADSLIVLRAQLTELNRARDLNTVEPGEAQRQLNRMTIAVLNMVEAI